MKLLILGDFFYDYPNIHKDIEELSEFINKNNYKVILNLEGPITNEINGIKKNGEVLKQSMISIDILKRLNVVAVCLANNHIMDFGDKGLIETIEILKNNNIKYVGAGKDLKNALRPININDGERNIWIQNFAWNIEEAIYATKDSSGCAPREENVILKSTIALKERYPNDIIINIYHWGFEYNLKPMPLDIKLAHDSIDAGASIIIGHHPHNIQSYEVYKNKQIFYSLGNFYFSSMRDEFSTKLFPVDISARCNFGMAIGLETKNMKIIQKMGIIYDVDKKKSFIKELPNELMDDISDIDYSEPEYVKKCKENSVNINPILTLDLKRNKKKLSKMFRAVQVYLILKRFRNNYIGNLICDIGKKIYLKIQKISG
jgi:hypothetical protein